MTTTDKIDAINYGYALTLTQTADLPDTLGAVIMVEKLEDPNAERFANRLDQLVTD